MIRQYYRSFYTDNISKLIQFNKKNRKLTRNSLLFAYIILLKKIRKTLKINVKYYEL